MRLRNSLIAGLIILILIPLSAFSKPLHSKIKKSQTVEFVAGELVVRLKQPATTDKSETASRWSGVTQRLARALNQKSAPTAKVFATDATFAVITVPENRKAAAIDALKQDSAVAYSEPNYLYHAYEIRNEGAPNDELYPLLWGMSNSGAADAAGQVGRTGADIHVEPVWAKGITGSREIKVAIIDTGIEYDHPDLVDNIWTNPKEIPGNGIDDDGNGFIDDVHGWSFAPKAPGDSSPAGDPRDDHYHGTHCAGTIGGSGNNGFGVAGVNWQVTMVPVKFLDSKGSGSLAAAVQAIQYATKIGVQVMSNSWGGGAWAQALFDAITEARNKGIVFVAAAGNDSNDNDSGPSYPASYAVDNIIAVAATDNLDRIAKFSNYGQKAVHVAAPGVKILSTVPFKKGAYKTLSGTSMATPHVSGIVALMLAQDPKRTYAEIKQTLIDTSDRTHALTRKSVSGGRVNVQNAFNGIVPPAPVAPPESAWVDVAYTLETPHPYATSTNYKYPVSVPGAKYIRVVFESLDAEKGFDYVRVQQANGDEIETLTGVKSQYTTDYLEGNSATIVLESDETVTKDGFKVAKLQAIF